MLRKCVISISIQYPGKFMEVLPDDMVGTEVAIENGVSILLTELFGEGVLVDDVTVEDSQPDYEHDGLIYHS